jgi:hypothetical protein
MSNTRFRINGTKMNAKSIFDRVRTDMALPTATLSVEESVDGLLKTIGDATPVEDLVLRNYNGDALPW